MYHDWRALACIKTKLKIVPLVDERERIAINDSRLPSTTAKIFCLLEVEWRINFCFRMFEIKCKNVSYSSGWKLIGL